MQRTQKVQMTQAMRWVFRVVGTLCLLGLNAWAAGPVLDVAAVGQKPVSLRPYFAVMEDPGGAMALADVQSDAAASRFAPGEATKRPLNFGSTASAYWLRMDVDNLSDSAVDAMLEIYYPRLAEVDFYRVASGQLLQSVKTGYARPFADRAYPHRFFLLPLPVAPGTKQTVYIRVKSPTALEVPAQLWKRSAFQSYEDTDNMTQAAYFGMFIALALYNILLWISLKERNYLFYVLFISSLAMALSASTGMGIQYIWGDVPGWTAISFAVSGHLSLVWLISFARRLLATEVATPRWDLVLKVAIGINAVLACTNFVSYTSKLSAMVIGLTSLLLLAYAVMGVVRKQRVAVLFTVAFVVVLLGAVASMLRVLGVLPANFFTINGIQIGSAFEMILLSFTLADRFHVLRAEKEKAQQRLVETLQSSERVLEAQVRQRTRALHQKNTELEQAMITISDVERIARHDLRTPLASLAAAPGLLRGLRPATPREENILNMMENAANHALGMVNLSLDLFRMENGSYDFRPVPVNLTALVDNVVQHLSVHAASKEVRIEVAPCAQAVWAHAEVSLCYSIIANLGKNAIEAAPEQSTVTFSLAPSRTAGGISPGKVSVRIHNQGEVPVAMQARFFEKYATSGKSGGTGLGTYSSHLLASVQGGTLRMETSAATGTSLTLELASAPALNVFFAPPTPESVADTTRLGNAPVAAAVSEASTVAGALEASATAAAFEVLLVDDDDFCRMLTELLFENMPVNVREAVNGRLALEAVRAIRPDLIILDIEMPILGGKEALQQIRAYQAESGQAPSLIVAMTGHDDVLSREVYRQIGFDVCLTKPCNAADIQTLLETLAQRQR
jgi:signal transduction histidine kinase/ActR/RegA family two-component response regulator